MQRLSVEDQVATFRSYCTGFGHTTGTPITKACFTMGTGRVPKPKLNVSDNVAKALSAWR